MSMVLWLVVLHQLTYCSSVLPLLLATRWEAPGGIGSSSGGWPTIFLQYFDAIGWVHGLLTCKTASGITYIVLVQTLNAYLSYPLLLLLYSYIITCIVLVTLVVSFDFI